MATNQYSNDITSSAAPAPRNTGGTPANPGEADPNGSNPLYGFAARYNPSQLENIWSNPWAILPDVFPGMDMRGAGYQALRDIGADPLTLYNIMAGQGGDLSGGTATGNYANWLANLLASYGSVGGRGFSGRELLSSVFNPGEGSALENILTAGDASTQMRTIFNMLRDASNVGLNPLAARGYQAAAARAGDQAINKMMTSGSNEGVNNMPIYQVLREIAPGLVPG